MSNHSSWCQCLQFVQIERWRPCKASNCKAGRRCHRTCGVQPVATTAFLKRAVKPRDDFLGSAKTTNKAEPSRAELFHFFDMILWSYLCLFGGITFPSEMRALPSPNFLLLLYLCPPSQCFFFTYVLSVLSHQQYTNPVQNIPHNE